MYISTLESDFRSAHNKQDIPEDARGKADPQTYLHRIGRTGRFGRVGVSISFVYDHKSWTELTEIQRYFNIDMQRLDTNDWDAVEETVQSIIKSSRAGQNFDMTM
jgi:ATP-dependent RNA helicase DDX19/DBP5